MEILKRKLAGLVLMQEAGDVSNGGGFDILNGSLDDIEDLPQFMAFPSGAYVVELPDGLVEKKIGEHPAVSMKVRHVETKELSDPNTPESEQVKPGDQTDIAFMLDNETGRGFLKIALKAIGERVGTKNPRELMAAAKGVQALIVVKKTKDEAKQREYTNLVRMALI